MTVHDDIAEFVNNYISVRTRYTTSDPKKANAIVKALDTAGYNAQVTFTTKRTLNGAGFVVDEKITESVIRTDATPTQFKEVRDAMKLASANEN